MRFVLAFGESTKTVSARAKVTTWANMTCDVVVASARARNRKRLYHYPNALITYLFCYNTDNAPDRVTGSNPGTGWISRRLTSFKFLENPYIDFSVGSCCERMGANFPFHCRCYSILRNSAELICQTWKWKRTQTQLMRWASSGFTASLSLHLA